MKGVELCLPSPNSQMPVFSASPNPNSTKFGFSVLIRILPSYYSLKTSTFSSRDSAPILEQKRPLVETNHDEEGEVGENYEQASDQGVLVVRRPVKEFSGQGNDDFSTDSSADNLNASSSSSSLVIDVGLSEFAKKMPIFEPERVELSSKQKPLTVNLELALYRAKVLGRNYRFDEAIQLLDKCIALWPEDGRPYVTLGKILSKQSKTKEARAVYERGCQATQGENPYIWQCWAVLENKIGNVRRARELFDAATVADKKHIAAWHGWAVLELKQGNVKKARNLLGKGLKYCGGNEYVYQTLALLEAKANRTEQARYLFKQATKCNPKSCASWLAWAQLEVQQENNFAARQLFEKAVQASPKNRFAWHVWGVFEASLDNVEMGRKLLKIGHAINPRDPVLLQSLALLEYKDSTANLARVLFRKASELDPRHQPVWIAWGWMEWKEGNIATARQLYQRALSIDSTSESAARCLQAWGVLEQRVGNHSTARRLLRSSLNINSQSYITWMTWAAMEEEQGNSTRAEEIRDLYFQQRTEVVDDASWVTGFLDVIDPTLDSIKKLLNFGQNSYDEGRDVLKSMRNSSSGSSVEQVEGTSLGSIDKGSAEERPGFISRSGFDLDAFVKGKLFLDASKLDIQLETREPREPYKPKATKSIWRSRRIPTT